MKTRLSLTALLILAALSFTLRGQNATIVLNYMDVNPGMQGDYVLVEMEWKKFHQKKIDAGLMAGWQLWRNVYAVPEDPYQYITIDWYNNVEQSLTPLPEGFWEKEVAPLFTEEEQNYNWEMTMKSRTLVRKEVMHRVMQLNGEEASKYIVVNRMKVKEGNDSDYLEAESTYSKPLQEAKIKDGQMNHWSVWQAWPYREKQVRYSTVDGYASLAQLNGGGADLLEQVHPGMTWDEWMEKVSENRIMSSIEIWELVDAVFPEAQ